MGLCKTSIFSISTFINASDLKFCTRSYSSCVYPGRGSNGKVCKMMTSHFRTLSVFVPLNFDQSVVTLFRGASVAPPSPPSG